MTPGHGQERGDRLWATRLGWAEVSKGEKLGQLNRLNN